MRKIAGHIAYGLKQNLHVQPTVGVILHFPMGGASAATPDSHSEDSTVASSPTSGNSVKILLRSTTPQDLLSDLGKPSCIFYKEEDKMRIHSVFEDLASDKGKLSGGEEEQELASDSENVVLDENAVDKGTVLFCIGGFVDSR